MIVSGAYCVLTRFLACRGGNTAILFAFSALPLFGAAGIGLDFARAY